MHRLQSLTSPGKETRKFYVTQEIQTLITSDNPDFPVREFDRLRERYLLGQVVTVSLLGDPNKQGPMLEKLNSLYEVWAFCLRKKPIDIQWRFFGRFIDTDQFVALVPHKRLDLGTATAYQRQAALVPSQWDRELGPDKAHTGNYCEEYVSEQARDVDKPD